MLGLFSGLFKGWLGAVLTLIVGISAIFAGYSIDQDTIAFKDHGKEATAIVEQVEWKEKLVTGKEKKFKIEISFETEKKEAIKTKLSVSAEQGKALRDSDDAKVKIIYLPESPDTVRLIEDKGESGTFAYVLGVLALLWAAFSVYRLTRKSTE